MPTSSPFDMFVNERVLYVKLRGVWTPEITKTALLQVQRHMLPLCNQPWAAYVDMLDWIMPSIEAMNGFAEIYQWCIDHNQTHEATICKFSMQRQIVQNASDYNQDTQIYTSSPAEAVTWLNNHGFSALVPGFTRNQTELVPSD